MWVLPVDGRKDMFQMIINILLVLSVLLNAFFALKLEQEMKADRRIADKRQENVNKMLGEVSLYNARFEKYVNDQFAAIEKKFEDLPIEQMDEETKRLKNFNDGIDNIMNYGFDIPKINREGLKNG
jgi:hypothetical protein